MPFLVHQPIRNGNDKQREDGGTEQADEFGAIHKIGSRDYLVPTTDLVLSGVQTLPKAGDHVRETDGAKTFVYEVMAPGNEPPFRYSDPYRNTLRIHTKLVPRSGRS